MILTVRDCEAAYPDRVSSQALNEMFDAMNRGETEESEGENDADGEDAAPSEATSSFSSRPRRRSSLAIMGRVPQLEIRIGSVDEPLLGLSASQHVS